MQMCLSQQAGQHFAAVYVLFALFTAGDMSVFRLGSIADL